MAEKYNLVRWHTNLFQYLPFDLGTVRRVIAKLLDDAFDLIGMRRFAIANPDIAYQSRIE